MKNYTFEEYLESEYPTHKQELLVLRDDEVRERDLRLLHYPHTALFEMSFTEMDRANQWCWQNIGPSEGQCLQYQSEFPACNLSEEHIHKGTWTTHWLAKTNYNFGYNEWYFVNKNEQVRFLEQLQRMKAI